MKFNSRLIASIDATDSGAAVSFTDGSAYTYDMPADTVTAWCAADSVGKFFLSMVRGQFPTTKTRSSDAARRNG